MKHQRRPLGHRKNVVTRRLDSSLSGDHVFPEELDFIFRVVGASPNALDEHAVYNASRISWQAVYNIESFGHAGYIICASLRLTVP